MFYIYFNVVNVPQTCNCSEEFRQLCSIEKCNCDKGKCSNCVEFYSFTKQKVDEITKLQLKTRKKEKICISFLLFLYQNSWFLHRHRHFGLVYFRKIIEFKQSNNDSEKRVGNFIYGILQYRFAD